MPHKQGENFVSGLYKCSITLIIINKEVSNYKEIRSIWDTV